MLFSIYRIHNIQSLEIVGDMAFNIKTGVKQIIYCKQTYS